MAKIKYKTYGLPNQECSDAAKLKPEWYMPTCNYIIDRATSSDNHSLITEYLVAAKGEVADSALNRVLKPLTSEDPTLAGVKIGVKRNVDFIKPIVRRYMGEFIKQYTNFQVYALDPTVILERNTNLNNELDNILQQMFINEMNAQGFDTGKESKPVPELSEYIPQQQSKFITDAVIKNQNRLNLILSETDEMTKMIQAFYYWFSTNRVITYKSIRNNDVIYDVIHPLEYFRVPSGNKYIKDDDMGCRVFKMTVNQIIENFKSILKPEDVTYLKEHNETSNPYVRYGELLNRAISDVYDLSTVFQHAAEVTATDFSRTINCYHAVGKTQRQVQTLTFVDMFGETTTMEVDGTYKLDPEHGDIELTTEYRPEFWEYYRFGDELEGVYSIPQPCAVQRHLFNNHAYCENPYNGLYESIEGFTTEPIPYTLTDINILNMILLIQIERTIAKYRPGTMILPESLLQDSDEYTLEQRLASMLLDDNLIINDSEVNANILQATKMLQNSTVEHYIMSLFDIRQRLKEEAYEMADMTPSRMGNTTPYAGKATTEMNINYSIAGSILLFESFNKMRERDYEGLIDCSRIAWANGKVGAFTNNNGTSDIINLILHPDDNLANMGVFVRNNAIESEKMNQLKQFGQAAMQSGDYPVAAKIATSDNSTQILKYVEDFTAATRKYNQEIEAQKNATAKQINDDNIAAQQAQREFEANIEQFKQNAETERTLIKQGVQDTASGDATSEFKKQNDAIKNRLAERKLSLAERQQNHKESIDYAKMKVAAQKTANDLTIAKINKN